MHIRVAARLRRPAKDTALLAIGDRMKQPEFHERYLKCPDDERWELVGGTVYMASPLGLIHSDFHDQRHEKIWNLGDPQ